MKALFWKLLLGYIVIVILCSATILVGRAQPAPNYIPELKKCNGVPCYMDIELNRTTWDEAKQRFANTSGFELSPYYKGACTANGPVRCIITFSSPEVIFEIDLVVKVDAFLPFGSLISELGVPCAVYATYWRNLNLVIVSFSDRLVWVIGDGNWGIGPDSPIGEIDLGPYPPRQVCRAMGDENKYSWRGFGHYPPHK